MYELQKIFKLVKKDLTFEISNLIEQISYSGLRYLFWLSIPLIYNNSISFIATLTVVNLLTASIYNSILGGPSFYKLSKLDESQIKSSFTTIIISIVILNSFSFIFFTAFYNHNLVLSEILFICLFPLITSISDWNRKISILLEQNIKQLLKILLVYYLDNF